MNEQDGIDTAASPQSAARAASGGDVPQGLDPVGGIAGGLFVVLGIVFLLDALDVWDARTAIVLPVLVIGLGLALLSGALRGSVRGG
jgi:hypothetical protein